MQKRREDADSARHIQIESFTIIALIRFRWIRCAVVCYFSFVIFRLKDLLPSLEFDRFAFMAVAFQPKRTSLSSQPYIVFVACFIASIEQTVSMLKCTHELATQHQFTASIASNLTCEFFRLH